MIILEKNDEIYYNMENTFWERNTLGLHMEYQNIIYSRIRYLFIIFVLIIGMFLISNCSDDSHLEIEDTATITKASTRTVIPSRTATLTFTPSSTATIFPTVVMERDGYDFVKVDIRIQNQIPDDIELHGGLIMRELVNPY